MNTDERERERERVADVIDKDEPLGPELPLRRPAQELELRRPDVPVTLDGLAALKDTAIEILTTRNTLWDTAWLAALRRTTPSDWVLFKAREEDGGQIVGYLEDAGCDRVRPVMGIGITDVSDPVKIINGNDPTDFHYLQSANGFCRLTGERVFKIEGARSSKDDYAKDKVGTALDVAVRKACRANTDGCVVREFGFKSVAIEEIARAWAGTPKSVDQCRRGRGFGSHAERLGGRSERAPDIDPPICPFCKSKGVYRAAKGDRKAFYGCPKYGTHPDQKFIIDAAKWEQEQAQKAKAISTAPGSGITQNGTQSERMRGTPPAKTTPPSAEEVFGKVERQPGDEDED
jgi:hypothetical protein